MAAWGVHILLKNPLLQANFIAKDAFLLHYKQKYVLLCRCSRQQRCMQGLLDLSDAQLEDLMLLRQLYVTRRHLLSVKRLELMAGAQEKMPHPVDSVTRMSELATHLQKNASEDHNLLYNMSRAFYCGVSTTA